MPSDLLEVFHQLGGELLLPLLGSHAVAVLRLTSKALHAVINNSIASASINYPSRDDLAVLSQLPRLKRLSILNSSDSSSSSSSIPIPAFDIANPSSSTHGFLGLPSSSTAASFGAPAPSLDRAPLGAAAAPSLGALGIAPLGVAAAPSLHIAPLQLRLPPLQVKTPLIHEPGQRECLAQLCGLPALAGLTSLTLGQARGVDEDVCAAAARSLTALRALQLIDCTCVGDRAVPHLVRAQWASGLTTLRLENTMCTARCLAAVWAAPLLRALRVLELLIGAHSPDYEMYGGLVADDSFGLSSSSGDAQWAAGAFSAAQPPAFADALEVMAVTKRQARSELPNTDRRRGGFVPSELVLALAGLRLPRLRALALSCRPLPPETAQALAQAAWMAGEQLTRLELNGTEMGDGGAAALFATPGPPRFARLRALSLDDAALGAAGLRALAGARMPALTSLSLAWNEGLKADDAAAAGDALMGSDWPLLERLDLDSAADEKTLAWLPNAHWSRLNHLGVEGCFSIRLQDFYAALDGAFDNTDFSGARRRFESIMQSRCPGINVVWSE